jgi:hypothetical protein
MERAARVMADLPRMSEKQFSRAKKLLRRLCANYDRGNCLLLDDGYDPCPCPQLISNTLLCRYFRRAVLPADRELHEDVLGDCLKYCAGCGRPFAAAARNTIYCPICAANRARRSKRRWAAKNRVQSRKSRA